MATRNAVVLRESGPRHEEAGTSVYVVKPGMLVELTGEATWQPHATAGGQAMVAVVGLHWDKTQATVPTLDTNVAIGDEFTVVFPHLGDKVNFVTSDTIAAGGWVESDGSGGVRAQGSGYGLGVATKASDLTGSVGRVEVVVAPTGT